VFTLEHGADVVGWTGFGPRVFHSGASELRAVDHADFAVDKPHRSLGPALMLQRAAVLCASVHADVAYGFPNDAAVPIFRRLGYQPLGTLRRYACVLRHAAYLRRRVPPLIADAAGAFVDAVRHRSSNSDVEWVADFDSRFDELYDEARSQYGIVGCRRAANLAWRFGPVRKRIAVLTEHGGLLAYAVLLDAEHEVATLADFLAATPDHLRTLLAKLLPTLRREGYIGASAYYLGGRSVIDSLRSCGFVERTGGRVMTIRASARFLHPEHWYLTTADRDF
jgi:hypothetical protein